MKIKDITFNKKGSLGFSLLEVVIACLLGILISAYIVSIFVKNTGLVYQQATTVSAGLDVNQSLYQITNYIKQAESVSTSYSGYTSSGSVLVLQLPGLDASGNVLSGVSDYVVVTQDSTNNKILRLIVIPNSSSSRPAANTVLTTILKSITFIYYNSTGGMVTPSSASQVSTTLITGSGEGPVSSEASSSAQTTLRNTGS